jgi:D-tyrosyl-tRNA(Tyr) deacylase
VRVLVQAVSAASVTVEGQEVGSIGPGFLLFVAFAAGDDDRTISKMADKILKLRIFPDKNGKTNLSLKDMGGNILSVSQFTLYADVREGNRPSFAAALKPEEAKPLFALWNNLLRASLPSLATGIFGADMKVSLINDGPFTLWLDSAVLFGAKK